MPARPYQPSGQSNSGAIPLLVAACLGAALLGGVVEGFVSKWLSLLLVFPAVLGGFVGFAATWVINRSHVRAPWLAALVAAVAGLVAQGAVNGVQYAQFRSDLGSQFAENPKFAGVTDTAPLVDQALEEEVGQGGFVGYLKLRSQLGTEIKRAGHSGSGLKLDGVGFWILFGLNFLIAGGIAASSAYTRANAPYCEQCKTWYEKTEPVASGSGEKTAVAGTLKALDSGVFTDVPGAFGSPQASGVAVFHLLRCGVCADHEPQLSLTVVTTAGKKQKTNNLYKTMLRPDEARSLLTAFAAANAKSEAKSGAKPEAKSESTAG